MCQCERFVCCRLASFFHAVSCRPSASAPFHGSQDGVIRSCKADNSYVPLPAEEFCPNHQLLGQRRARNNEGWCHTSLSVVTKKQGQSREKRTEAHQRSTFWILKLSSSIPVYVGKL